MGAARELTRLAAGARTNVLDTLVGHLVGRSEVPCAVT